MGQRVRHVRPGGGENGPGAGSGRAPEAFCPTVNRRAQPAKPPSGAQDAPIGNRSSWALSRRASTFVDASPGRSVKADLLAEGLQRATLVGSRDGDPIQVALKLAPMPPSPRRGEKKGFCGGRQSRPPQNPHHSPFTSVGFLAMERVGSLPALTPPPTPRSIKISESFVPLSRSPLGGGRGEGAERGVLWRRPKAAATKPLFNPPSPPAVRPGEEGGKGGEGREKRPRPGQDPVTKNLHL